MLLAALRTLLGGSSQDPRYIGDLTFYTPFQTYFWRVSVGSSREDAVFRLGTPQREEDTRQLPRPKWYAQDYERAKAGTAVSFQYWRTGIDGLAVLGLDSSERVVFKVIAGT